MPAVDTSGSRTIQKKPPKLKKTVKVKASPPVPSGDQVDRNRAARAEQLAKSKSLSPDRQDEKRAPAQKKRDAAEVKKNVKDSYQKVVDKQKSVDSAGPVKLKPEYAKSRARKQAEVTARVAPVLKVLDQTTRPLHAIAAGTDAAITHKPVLKAAKAGLENKDKTTFSTVLKHAGVKNKYLRGGAGFVLDVGLDPTTYLTGGTGSVAAKASEKAAAKATEKATKAGLTAEQAAKFGERAAKKAAKTADQTSGVIVKVAGKEVPGVRKATAAASKPVRKAARKVTPERVRAASRNAAADVSPNVTPAGVAKETSRKAIRATRTARARTTQGEREAVNLAHAIKNVIGEANYAKVVDAIEAGKIGSLPPELRGHAITLRSKLKHVRRIQRRAGVKVGEVKHRPQVKVPAVTADTSVTAKALAKATRAADTANKRARVTEREHAAAQGRAEVLSRNVGGRAAEDVASRGRRTAVADLAPLKPTAADKSIARNRAKGDRLTLARKNRAVRKAAARKAAGYDPTIKGIADQTWYHGTGARGLSHDALDSTQTNIDSLFGQGIYLTNKPGIAHGYAASRSGRRGMYGKANAKKPPVIYKAKVNPKRILDLETAADPRFVRHLRESGHGIGHLGGNYSDPDPFINDAINEAMKVKGATNADIYDAFRHAVVEYAQDYGLSKGDVTEHFQDLASNLRGEGWDALTHVGGKRTGHQPHQVAIVLDPANMGTHGRPNPITSFGDRVAERTRPQRVTAPGLAPKYAAGGKGVTDSRAASTEAKKRASEVEGLRARAEATHLAEIEAGKTQRAAKTAAEKLNRKRDTGVKGYVPRKLTPEALDAMEETPVTVGKRSTKPASSKARKDTRPMSVLRKTKPGVYRQDLHAVIAERLAEGTASAAQAGLNRDLANLGREVKRGHPPTLDPKTEAVYHIKAGSPPRLVDKEELAGAVAPLRMNKAGTKLKGATPKSVGAGRYVVLPKEIVDRANEGISPSLGWSKKGLVRGYDKATAGFKSTALATLAFHVRNAIGDTSQAYVHQPGQKLAGNMVRAGRVLKASGRGEKAQRVMGRVEDGGGRLKAGKYGNVTYEEAARKLIDAGAARSGYTGRELRELGQSGRDGFKLPKVQAPGAVKRAVLNREDLPRLATAIHAVREGATWEEAAQMVADVHIDYGHLTQFERNVARRLAPFYTWTARNVPIQTKALVQRPGKFAAYQKLREEAAAIVQPEQQDPKTKELYRQLERAGVKMTGGWERYLSSFEQRNAGIPISWKGHKFTVSAGLPLTDLNELPGAAGGVAGQAREYFDKTASMGTPILKDPTEYGLNYSFFFRDQIERDNSPLVSAPNFVGSWPASWRKRLGVVRGPDKRSGKVVWKWPGKVDYVAHTVPGLSNQALKMMTPGADRQGKGLGAKALGFTGIKATPVDATSNAINLAYARGEEIQKRQSALRQQNNPANGELISAKNPTPEYTKLSAQLRIVNQIAYQGKSQRGDAKLPTQGGPPKLKASTAGRVKVPGVSGRVKVPGVGGRVKVPTG